MSAVSALSDASCGSDEVFLSPPSGTVGEKGQIIHRDWEVGFIFVPIFSFTVRSGNIFENKSGLPSH